MKCQDGKKLKGVRAGATAAPGIRVLQQSAASSFALGISLDRFGVDEIGVAVAHHEQCGATACQGDRELSCLIRGHHAFQRAGVSFEAFRMEPERGSKMAGAETEFFAPTKLHAVSILHF